MTRFYPTSWNSESPQGRLYLATLIDAHSRRVIGWAIADHMRTDLIKDALVMAMALRGERLEQVIFHFDRGTQYASTQMTAFAKSEPHHPADGRHRGLLGQRDGTTFLRHAQDRVLPPTCLAQQKPRHQERSAPGSKTATTGAADTPPSARSVPWTSNCNTQTRTRSPLKPCALTGGKARLLAVSTMLPASRRGATVDATRTTTWPGRGIEVASRFGWAPPRIPKSEIAVRWVSEHRLHLTGLTVRTRLSASLALIVCAATSLVLVVYWHLAQTTGPLDDISTARLVALVVTSYLGYVLVALALSLGSSLIAVASISSRWRLPRLTQLLLAWVAINLIAGPIVYAEQGLALAPPAVAALGRLPAWSALVAVLVVTFRCLAGRPPRPVVIALTFFSPFAAVVLNATLVGAVRGWGIGEFPYQPVFVSTKFVLWYLPLTVLPVIVIWLTVEGLRMNRDIGVRMITRIRVTPGRMAVFACAKITVLMVILLALPGSVVEAAHRSGISMVTLLACLLLGLVVLVVLALEDRWHLEEKSFGQAARLLVLIAAAWCAVWAVSYGVASLSWVLLRQPLNLAGYLALGFVAALMVVHRFPALLRWVLWGLAVALVAVLSSLPGLVTQPVFISADLADGLQPMLDETVSWLSWTSSILLPVGVLVGALLFRRDLTSAALIVVFASAWVAISADLTPLALDLALTVPILAAAFWRSPKRASVLTVHELALLTIVMFGIAYAPLLSALLPGPVLDILKPLAFVAPVVLLFTMDAGLFNTPGPSRRMRVLGATGGACFLLGVALSWVLVRDAEDAFAFIDLGKGLFTVPMALVLVVLTSSTLRKMQLPDR